MNYLSLICLFQLFFTVFFYAGYATGANSQPLAQDQCLSTNWPHELSDLSADPDLLFGRLDNGFRYVLRVNSEPQDRTGIFLDVQTGSLFEREDESGVAHFLEHMLFNGTTHFKSGELVEYFRSIGMSFGGDTNAHTSFDETVYKVILPASDEKTLREGLLVMSDYARGALLEESEIDRERGVILAEKHERDTPSYRSYKESTSFSYKGTLLPDRMVIGSEDVLKKLKRADLKEFYDTWYRPENMILVMVGDFQPAMAESLIFDYFSGIRGAGEPPVCPEYGTVSHEGIETFYHFEPEQGSTSVSIEVIWNKVPENDSFELQVSNLHRFMAARIINYRLNEIVEKSGSPLSSAMYYSGQLLDHYQYAALKANTDGKRWEKALAVLYRVLGQVIEYGFSPDELKRVKREIKQELESAVLTKNTRDSSHLAQMIIRSINNNRVFQSPEQEKELFTPLLAEITTEQLQGTLLSDWKHDTRLIEVIGTAELDKKTAHHEIKRIFLELQKKAIAPPTTKESVDFPYLSIAHNPGSYAVENDLQKIGGERIRFSNGTILNIKKTEYKKNSILMALHFGGGGKTAPSHGLPVLAETVVNGSGTGTLKKSELDELLAGSSVDYHFEVGLDSFVFEGYSLSSDFELLCQIIQSYLVDPGIRSEAYDVAMKRYKLMYQKFSSDIEGSAALELDPFFNGNAIGFGLPHWEQFKLLSLEDIRSWLLPSFLGAPLEISVVGDIDPELVKKFVSTYFGSLPVRDYIDNYTPVTPKFPKTERIDVEVDSTSETALIRIAWLTDDFWDIKKTRRLHVLAAIVEERLRKSVRERMGASYSPQVYSSSSRVYPHLGFIMASVISDSTKTTLMENEILEVIRSLVKDPITLQEVEQAKNVIITSLKDAVRSNRYWLSSVLALSSKYPVQLEWQATMLADFHSISVEDIESLAKLYLQEKRMAIGVVRPSSPL